MADEQLRLVASVRDEFSANLKKLDSLLKGVASNPAAKSTAKDWQGVRDNLNRITGDLNSGLAPALSRIGVQSLSVGGAVAGIGLAIKSFATNTRDLNLFSKSIGLGVEQLRELQAVGEHFGVSWDTAQGSLKAFAGNLDQIHRRWGEAYGQLRAMNLGDLAEKLVSAPNMQAAVDTAFEGIKTIQSPTRRRQVAELLFGSDQWATVASELTPKVRAEIKKMLGEIPAGSAEAADAFALNFTKMSLSVERLRNEAIGPLLPDVNELFTTLNNPQVFGAIKTEFDGITVGVKDFIKEIRGAIDFLGNLKDKAREAITGSKDGKIGVVEDLRPSDEIAKRQSQIEKLAPQLERAESILARREGRGDMEGASEARRRRDALLEQTKRLADEIQALRRGGATVQQQSFNGGGFGLGGMIQNASFGGGGLGGPGGFRFGFGNGFSPGGGPIGGSLSRGGSLEGGAPRGDGQGTRGSAKMGEMMGYAMDQLRREGVPEAQLRTAAAHLVGQAHMESGLNPNQSHDSGTGYGIYGARDPAPGRGRRTDMLRWLAANGYAPNSAEGQMRYMAREAMSGRYGRTKSILMGNGTGDLDTDTNTITREFESPAVVNQRSHAVRRALASDVVEARRAAGMFPSVRSRADLAGAAGTADVMYPLGWGRREADGTSGGDSMMGRAFGPNGVAAPPTQINNKGTVSVQLMGELGKLPAKVTMDGLFQDVHVTRGTQLA